MSNIDKGKRLIINTFIVGIGAIASKGIMFLMAPLFSRWLSIEDYGAFDLVTTYVALLLPICTLSIIEAVFRFLLDDINEHERKNIISSAIFVVLGGYCTCLFAYLGVSFLCASIHFEWAVPTLLLAQMFFTCFSEVARGMKKMKIYSIFNIISVLLLASLSTVFLLVFKWGLNGIVLGYSIAYFISAIGLLLLTKSYKYISIKAINMKTTSNMLSYSWPLIPNSISWWVVNVSDRLIINSVIGLTANGIYAVANKIPAIVNVLFSIFHVSWIQSASESITDNDYTQYCNAVFNKLIPFIFSSVAVLISLNFIFYYYIFDSSKYLDAYYYSPILIVAAGISCIGQFLGGIMIAYKKTKQNGFTNILAAGSKIVINMLMIYNLGMYAASLSTLFAYMILVIARYKMIQKHIKLHIKFKNLLVLACVLGVFIGVYFNIRQVNYCLMLIAFTMFFVINRGLFVRVLASFSKRANA